MKKIYINKSSGIWYFRYQIPPKYRLIFGNKTEIKKSLYTSDKIDAKVLCLEYEAQILKQIAGYREMENIQTRKVIKVVLSTFLMRIENAYNAIVYPLSQQATTQHTDFVEVVEDVSELDTNDAHNYVGEDKRGLLLNSISPDNQTLDELVDQYLCLLLDENPFIDQPHNSTGYYQVMMGLFDFGQCTYNAIKVNVK